MKGKKKVVPVSNMSRTFFCIKFNIKGLNVIRFGCQGAHHSLRKTIHIKYPPSLYKLWSYTYIIHWIKQVICYQKLPFIICLSYQSHLNSWASGLCTVLSRVGGGCLPIPRAGHHEEQGTGTLLTDLICFIISGAKKKIRWRDKRQSSLQDVYVFIFPRNGQKISSFLS